MKLQNSLDKQLRERARAVIPNGMYGHMSTRLLPDNFPQFFQRAKGAYIWDVDGNRYVDLMCAYGPNLLGYADDAVDAAYAAQMRIADTVTGPSALLVELAEQLVDMISHAAWTMFCKNGADATQIALMLAREHTQRKTVVLARGSYHGSFPWAAGRQAGVTLADKSYQAYCEYDDVASLEEAARFAGDDLAAIFATPFRHDAFRDQALPSIEYAQKAREICDRTGAVLVVDDVRAGFRMARDCSWTKVGVQPDISCWGKCLANGHPLSALMGSEPLRDAATRIYVTGSYWLQSAPMAAAIETLRRVRETDYLEKMQRLGQRLRQGLAERAATAGFGLRQTGPETMPLFLFEDDPDMRQGFFWCAQMLERGCYTHPWHNMFMCAALSEADIDLVLNASEGAFKDLAANRSRLEPNERMSFLGPQRAAAR